MRKVFIEIAIIDAVKKLLTGRVNELLGELDFVVPLVEFENFGGGFVVCPCLALGSSERTEKERIIFVDAYAMTIVFNVPETPESELHCYAYADAVGKALEENPTLGGFVDRAVVIGKKYVPPKKPFIGEGWNVVLSLRITVEGINNVC